MNEQTKLIVLTIVIAVVIVIIFLSLNRDPTCVRNSEHHVSSGQQNGKAKKTNLDLIMPYIDRVITIDEKIPPIVLPFQNVNIPSVSSVAKSSRPTGKCCQPNDNSEEPSSGTIISLDGENCVARNDARCLKEKVDHNKYLEAWTHNELCQWINAPLSGYNGVINPSALSYTLNPPLVVPLGQKGYNMVPPYPPTPVINLSGKNVLVVGASKNIGLAIAETLKGHGCNVIGTSRDPSCYNNTNFCFPLLKLDIRKPCEVKDFFKHLMANQFSNGKIDVLINCPGIQWRGHLEKANGEDLSDMLHFQVGGYQRVVYHALPYMKHSNSTKVISFGSVAGEFPNPIGGYAIAKKALQMWNDVHMVEAMTRKAMGESTYEPTFTLVEPGVIQSSIGLYEHYFAADADLNSDINRGAIMTFTSAQSAATALFPILASAPPCPTVPALCNSTPQIVADAVYQIILAPQPSVRYLVDPAVPAFNIVPAVVGANVLSADDVICNVSLPLLAGFYFPPANAALAQSILNNSFCQ